MYEITRAAAPAPNSMPRAKTQERLTMEQLEVGDAFTVTEDVAQRRAKEAKRLLRPKVFTIRKVPRVGWQVRRAA